MSEVFTLTPEPDTLIYTFGGNPAVLRVPAGSIIEIETEDCFGGKVRSVQDLPSAVCDLAHLNPVTGPIHVEGAQPGDVLAVHLAQIRPRRDWAVSSTFPHFGALTGTGTTAMLHEALEERVWMYEIDHDAGTCRYQARGSDFSVDLPLDPFHGTIGVAPAAGERMMSVTPAAHGGNMDTPETRSGTTVYLPVHEEGAMLAIGDGHCRQGEGEVCGTAVEAAMATTIVVDVIKNATIAWPRLQDDTYLMSTGSTKPLEDAYRVSQRDMVGWVAQLTGLDLLDALQLVSQAGLAPTGNVVDTNYTMVAKMPSSLLGGVDIFDGVHERLRDLGRSYLQHR
ncbi:acetamidase/formamidase family protein [Mobilicoccus pelagius]|uniref:Putative acetamidase n=1 Tax=Mobilicoccus pelagius NBRC 104925 TaxID=1089455 RepID=H5UPM8_9MICO|nr:acetamidase/formamidase family protein [Mobilicoccus pelagius]GAB47686.1 putative acetamidase [Mobilicoccus pelagius NBRC 104925]